MSARAWLTYTVVTVGFWGLWGALTDLPVRHGFPNTLVYCVWAVTMIPPCLFALRRVGWRLQYDGKSILYGSLIGLLGSGGQMLLFHALKSGPAYLIFPVISLSPLITIVMSLALLGERTGKLGTLGIVMALFSLPLFDYSADSHPAAFGQPSFWGPVAVSSAWGREV